MVEVQAHGHAQHMVSFLQVCPVCVWLGVTVWLTHTHSGGHEGGNMGDGEMTCGDSGREMAAKAGLGHSECSGPTTEDGLLGEYDQRRGGWRKEMSHRHRTYLGGVRGCSGDRSQAGSNECCSHLDADYRALTCPSLWVQTWSPESSPGPS